MNRGVSGLSIVCALIAAASCGSEEDAVVMLDSPLSGAYVELWTGANYSGSKLTIPAGDDMNDFSLTSFNDLVRSVRVFNGAAVYLFTDHTWTGSSLYVSSNIPDLTSVGFSNVASSLLWTPIPGYYYSTGCNGLSPCVELWANSNYTGNVLSIYGYLDFNDLYFPAWDNIISSVKVSSGHSVRLCEDYMWTGSCVTLSSNNSDLTTIGMDNVISSVRF